MGRQKVQVEDTVVEISDRARERRKEFLQAIFDLHDSSLRGFLWRLVGSKEQVSDLSQELYLRLLKSDSTVQLADITRAYLFKAALNLVREEARQRTSRYASQHVTLEEDYIRSPEPTQERHLHYQQSISVVSEGLGELTPAERRVLLLQRINDMTIDEISLATGISRRTVQRRLASALNHLAGKLEKAERSKR